jgi:hypothetical protein
MSYTIIEVSCNVTAVSSCFFSEFWRNIRLMPVNHLQDQFNMDCDSKNKIVEFYYKYIFVSYYVTHLMQSQVGNQHLTTVTSTHRMETLHHVSSSSLQWEASWKSVSSNNHVFSAQTSSASCLGGTGFRSCSTDQLPHFFQSLWVGSQECPLQPLPYLAHYVTGTDKHETDVM